MLKGGPKTRPNKIAYTAALSSCGKAGKIDQALSLFRQMKDQGLPADRVAYNALFAALRVAKRSDAAFELWDEMLGHPAKLTQTNKIASAQGIPISPDIITVTDALGAMSSGPDSAEKRSKIDQVFAEAVKRGGVLKPNMLDSPKWDFDLSGMAFPVARAACRYLLHCIRDASKTQDLQTITFVTGRGLQADADGSKSLKKYVREVLMEDFQPSLASNVPASRDAVEVHNESLTKWIKTNTI
jgi:pentatricopeptide repeat protein